MDQLTLNPIKLVEGTIQLPGSKSLSNRILLLTALARGKTEVYNLLHSDDTSHMLDALKRLGVKMEVSADRTRCVIEGMGGPFREQVTDLYLGNAGTAIRPMCAALCFGSGEFTLSGEPRMHERPIGDLVDALRQLGARIDYLQNDGYPPLKIHADRIAGGEASVRGNVSSQFLTALLLAAPLAERDVVIRVEGELVSKPYIDITLDVIRRFGATVNASGYEQFQVSGGEGYQSPGSVLVEGDASSAGYFMAAAAIKGGTVRVNGVGSQSTQGDVKLASVLEQMGAEVRMGPDWVEVSSGDLHGVDLDLNHIPDAAMTVATTALFAKGATAIRNIANWRVKETDRLSAMADGLRRVGADVTEGPDFIEIDPPDQIKAAEIDTYNDHRIAMSFSLAALGSAPIMINDPDCVSKTFPDYFEKWASITS